MKKTILAMAGAALLTSASPVPQPQGGGGGPVATTLLFIEITYEFAVDP